jgi:hypothetical protein
VLQSVRTWSVRLVGLLGLPVLVGLVLCATAAPAEGGLADPCALPGVTAPATYAHVIVIMEENLSYKNAIGSVKAPYLNQLASQCALATNFHNETHGSQPNYMAATSGAATGTGVHSSNTSIYQQASSWNDLEESMGGNCGATATHYKRGHDPAYWYTPLAAACKLYDVPVAATDTGTIALPPTLPAYTFITPNYCHDDHWLSGCSEPDTVAARLQAMDTWLAGAIGELTATADYQAGKTLIFVVFDESSSKTTTLVPAIALAAAIQPVKDGTAYDQYALLRASEEALGITTYLGNAATANDMRLGMHF